MPTIERRPEMQVLRDINWDFLEAACIAIAWEYAELQRQTLDSSCWPPGRARELYARGRAPCAERGLLLAAQQHGVPYTWRRIEANGQHKLFIQSGRVTLLQEPMKELRGHPQAAKYKIELAQMHGVMRQLEFDFGPHFHRPLDLSDNILAVLCHGSPDTRLPTDGMPIGGFFLAVPDHLYRSWVARWDIRRLALDGRDGLAPVASEVSILRDELQPDRVMVRRKERARRAMDGE